MNVGLRMMEQLTEEYEEKLKAAGRAKAGLERRIAKARTLADAAERPVAFYFMEAFSSMCDEDGTPEIYNLLLREAEQAKRKKLQEVEHEER